MIDRVTVPAGQTQNIDGRYAWWYTAGFAGGAAVVRVDDSRDYSLSGGQHDGARAKEGQHFYRLKVTADPAGALVVTFGTEHTDPWPGIVVQQGGSQTSKVQDIGTGNFNAGALVTLPGPLGTNLSLVANPNRRCFFIQNVGVLPIYVQLYDAASGVGAGDGVNWFCQILAPASALLAGDGGSLSLVGWTGIVQVTGAAGAKFCSGSF